MAHSLIKSFLFIMHLTKESKLFYLNIFVYRHFASMYVCVPSTCLAPSEGVRAFGTRVTDGCEPSYGFWGPNPGPLQEQAALDHQPSLQPLPPSSLKCLKAHCLRVKSQSLTDTIKAILLISALPASQYMFAIGFCFNCVAL